MKSPQVQISDYIKDKENYSDMQVLKSGGGWYLGTIYTDPETGFQEPGTRDSDYFASKQIAEEYLEQVKVDEAAAEALRLWP